MLAPMAVFALVHGSMHGSWCWRELVPLLEQRGHRAVTPDLPCDDVAAGLAEYAAEYGAKPERWLFLTGEKAALRELSVSGFHLPVGDATPEDLARGAEAVMHSTRFILVDAQGHIRGYYDGGDEKAMESLRLHVRRLASDTAS